MAEVDRGQSEVASEGGRLLACCAIRYILRAHNFAESRAFR